MKRIKREWCEKAEKIFKKEKVVSFIECCCWVKKDENWEMSKVESWKLEVALQLNIYVFSLKEKNWKILTETCETQTFINFHYKFGDRIS